MQYAIFVGDFGFGGTVVVVKDLLRAAGGVRVQHENLAKMRVRGFEQVEPVALGFGERLLMAENHLLGVVVQLAQGNEAAAFLDDVGPWNLEALRVGKNAWFLLLNQHSLLPPCAEIAGRAGVDTFAALGIEKLGKAENDAHQVEWAALIVSLLHGGGNLVVGLGDHVVQADSGGIVAPCAKRINACHLEGITPQEEAKFAYGSPTMRGVGTSVRFGSIVSQRARAAFQRGRRSVRKITHVRTRARRPALSLSSIGPEVLNSPSFSGVAA